MNQRPNDVLAQSISDRLRNSAVERDRPFAEILELYAVERFLDRLGRSQYRESFVLKGALLLRAWLGVHTRPTRDIDLLGPEYLDADGLRELIADLLQESDDRASDDGIVFDIDSIIIRPIRIGSAVLGMQAKIDARLGRTRLRYKVDVGLGDALYPPAVEMVMPDALLGLPVASVRAYTPYTTIAEKLEAIVVLGFANSRTKDYFDLHELPRSLTFDGTVLAETVRRVFARRRTEIPPLPLDGLTAAFANEPLQSTRWRGFLEKSQLSGPEEGDFPAVVSAIRHFVDPVLDAAREGQEFDRRWEPGGPWR